MLWVLITSHNRRPLTVTCLERLGKATAQAGIDMRVVLTDDGSTDGTAAAVEQTGANVTVIHGDGTLFWAKGMASSEAYARRNGFNHGDYLLWLNDDVQLDNDALVNLMATANANRDCVVVGAVRERDNATVSYSGLVRTGLHPLNVRPVLPHADQAIEVQTFNGNVVLIPYSVAERVGEIDAGFSHALADTDYGLRCQAAGVRVLLGAGTFGECPRRAPMKYASLWAAWKAFTSTKESPSASTLRFVKRHGGKAWPVFWAETYASWWVRAIMQASRERRAASSKAT